MSHEIEKRDRQVGIKMAWHNLTQVEEIVNRENAHPFEVVECECPSIYCGLEHEVPDGEVISAGAWKRLVADDDKLPVGPPYNPETYTPSNIAMFWTIIERALGKRPYQVVSAGSIRNRAQIFASIKVRDPFDIEGREFVDYLTLIDSFDGSLALQARYTCYCVVCANTLTASLHSGRSLGKAIHKKGFNEAASRITDSIETYFSRAEEIQKLLTTAHAHQVDEKEARCWIAGVDNAKKSKLSMADLQRTARMTELFRFGKGNKGETQLDAFSAITEFHTHESGRGTDTNVQWMTSEWGNSAAVKELALCGLANWKEFTEQGRSLLEKAGALIS